MKIVITFCLLFISSSLFAQNPNLYGKWKFQEVENKEKLDSTGYSMLKDLFADMTLQFNNNGLYKAVVMGNIEEGEWTEKNSKTITLTSNKGISSEVTIKNLTENQMILNIGGGEYNYIMKKENANQIEDLHKTEKSFDTVTVSRNQVSKKWYLVKRELSKELSPEGEKIIEELMIGSYLDLSKKKKYKVFMLGMKEKGKWYLSDGNDSIITKKGRNQRIWNIVSISENELVLLKGNNGSRWYFSTNNLNK